MSLKIDSEFKNLIPPLTSEEYQGLEQSIIAEGCRDALVTWQGTLIDGHNRYEICTRLRVRFDTKEHQFNDRDEVKEWIIRNQFGRRNISVNQRSLLALKLDDIVKAKVREKESIRKANQYNMTLAPVPKSETIHTDKELAKTAGVSPKTIQYARIIQKEGTEEQKERFKKDEAKAKTLFKEIRKPKEANPAMPKSGKLEAKEKEDTKKEVSNTGTSENASIISIEEITSQVNQETKNYDSEIILLCSEVEESASKKIMRIINLFHESQISQCVTNRAKATIRNIKDLINMMENEIF
jgi:hypothetical protein